MIKHNTSPTETEMNMTAEVALLLDGATAYWGNDTGRAFKPVFQFEVTGVKADKQMTDTATYKFRLYYDSLTVLADAEQVAFNAGNTIVNYLTYVCATAETLDPIINLSFGGFVLPVAMTVFLTVESDNANDDNVSIGNLSIYEDTDATEYSSTGKLPRVDIKTSLDATPMATSDFQSSCDLALKALAFDRFMAVACENNLITSHVVDDSVLAKALTNDGDISDYNEATDSLEALYDKLAAMFSAETLANLKSSFERH